MKDDDRHEPRAPAARIDETNMRTKRLLIYSHDTYGLGHIRRSLSIAGETVNGHDDVSALIVTGSPRCHAFGAPEGVDILKIPSVIKETGGGYRARSLNMSLEEILRLRARLLIGAVQSFEPDVVLVDHSVVGVEGELLPLFDVLPAMKRRPTLVYGMRDIVDDAEVVRAEWTRLGAWRHIDQTYDKILVYGDDRVRTTAHDLDLQNRLPGKVEWTGYLGKQMPAGLGEDETPYVLVCAGGGGDGQALISRYADFLESRPKTLPFRSVVVPGPFLSARRRRTLRDRLYDSGQPVRVIDFSDRMEELMAGAACVISMGGYNAVVELLSCGKPAMLLPRERPRLEQWLRAERLAPVTGFRICRGDDCSPKCFETFIDDALSGRIARHDAVDLGGRARAAQALRLMMGAARPVRPVTGEPRLLVS